MTLSQDQVVALLTASRETVISVAATVDALVAQLDAVILSMTEPKKRKCPKCGSDRLIAADDGFVCDVCTHAFIPTPTDKGDA